MVIFVDDGLPIRVEYKNGVYVAELPEAKAIKTAFHYLETHPEARGKLQVRKSEAIPYTSTEAEHFKPNLKEVATTESQHSRETTTRVYDNYRFVLLEEIKHKPQDLIDRYSLFLSSLPNKDGRKILVQSMTEAAHYNIMKSLRTRGSNANGIYVLESDPEKPKAVFIYAPTPTKTIRAFLGLQKHTSEANKNERRLPLADLEALLDFE